MTMGRKEGNAMGWYLLTPPPNPHCMSVPYFHLRMDYIEMIEAFTEFHVNHLNLLCTSAYFPTTHTPLSLDI